ncbi:peptidase domain-containing ABC transporter [Aquimarina agarivorans]|uniref:peptidase domain-containing ABC transporter n=1 Tax=Aquimarina agarivorans TaxID=980584 RepID=UPI000248E7C2|nr:peptidase domain-containing ABC transporter [Aquimarina agarivorans]
MKPKNKKFKFIRQFDQMDCGPACLAMLSNYYGKTYSLQFFRNECFITKEGVSLDGIKHAALKVGFSCISEKLSIDQLIEINPTNAIIHWNQNHFVVLMAIKKTRNDGYSFKIADPAHGIISFNLKKFQEHWLSKGDLGICLQLKTTQNFYTNEIPVEKNISFKFLLDYLKPHYKQLIKLFILLFLGSCATLVFPFITEYLIDKGVQVKNLNVISTLLMAQLGVFLGVIIIDVFRNWILLRVGTKISITIVSNFLKKILLLPIHFFDTKMTGDFNQRIQDNERIEEFLTSQSLTTFFSLITFSVFFGVLWYYDITILLTYLLITTVAICWSLAWLNKRKILDYFVFQAKTENQDLIYEIINGVTELKLNQFEEHKRIEWERVQDKLFRTNSKILKLDQIQVSGYQFLNQFKNIVVTFLAATYVVNGTMSLGELLSVSYIIGQMNAPVNQLIDFFKSLQDAKLSFNRLSEIQEQKGEEEDKGLEKLKSESSVRGISLKNVNFKYEGPSAPYILKNINMHIPEGKVTAIVGASGSGKTTLMKLLLKFYKPTTGAILVNGQNLQNISPTSLREQAGIVMQDGYIFSDTIFRNITTGDKNINRKRLFKSAEIANISEFINEFPNDFSTKIGASGVGMSGGQKQRMLIARAIYKNPNYLFFDEATSALDAENEKQIHENLQKFYEGRTVLIIAHRLSTVKDADQIIVLDRGEIVEVGNHNELVTNRSNYYNLIKNQLELGN